MGIRNYLKAFGAVLCMAMLVAAFAAGPTRSFAQTTGGVVYRPTSITSATFSLKYKRMSGHEDQPTYSGPYAARGNKQKTILKIAVESASGGTVMKRVSYDRFRNYIRSGETTFYMDYTWRTNSSGVRYRYINSIEVSNRAG